MTNPKRILIPTMGAAHYLGLPTPSAATRTPTSAKPTVSAALTRPTSISHTTTSSRPAQPTARKQQGATAMPFSKLMNGFRAPAVAAQPEPSQTMSFPEMQNGVATGRRFEVHVPSSATPKIDAAATARKVIAAGQRAATGETARSTNPAKSTADRIVAAGERARGKA
ncbi:hypothetical protein [Paraburkholderia sediminicola]|uniref:hypothetical protein n=1 Tax=Paraburkholderia sediminicola TaxID=458836 RepID=UPI0038B8DCB6